LALTKDVGARSRQANEVARDLVVISLAARRGVA
jgi:hypothetical protein